MPTFLWKGRTLAGETQSGEIEVARQEDVADALRKRRILVSSVKAKAGGFSLPKFGGGPSVSTKDLAIFTRQFATMISAGLPLVQCLDILAKQSSKPSFARVISEVTREVEAGSTLSDALGRHRTVFDDLFRNMVAAGEAGGILDTIFQRLSIYIEKAVKLKRAVQSAMVYPIAVVVIAAAVITLILWKVVPQFTILFESMNVDLPLPTRIVIGASKFVGSFGIFIGVGLAITGALFRSYYRTQKGRYVVDGLMLKGPIIGPLLRKIAVSRFTRTMATLIASGVPILDCLEITARTSGNAIVEEASVF